MTQTAPAPRPVTVRCPFCTKLNRVDLNRISNRPKCAQCGRPILLDRPLTATEQDFDETIRTSSVPVLVDFYADWCGPCKMMAPAVETLARESVGRALVAKLDTDHAQRVASRFQIRGIPTSIVFKNGREVKRQTGAVPLATLRGMLT